MDLERGQQAKDYPRVLDRQLCQLVMLGQRTVWRHIEASTDSDESPTPKKLPKRLACDPDLGKLAGADHPLCAQKVESWVGAI
jgi:hypothetical protein